MKTESWQQCIVPSCGKKYNVNEQRTRCDCGELLDVRYKGDFPKSLQQTFSERLNHRQNIFDESGVWRYRELINFAGIDTEEPSSYSRKLVSLDGAEGRTKPFHLTRVAEYVGVTLVTFGSSSREIIQQALSKTTEWQPPSHMQGWLEQKRLFALPLATLRALQQHLRQTS